MNRIYTKIEGNTKERPTRLSRSFVERINQPGRYGDGHGGYGLSLVVKPRAGGGVRKAWVQRLIVEGQPVNIGLGPYPVVTLKEARDAALQNRRTVWQGLDPRSKSDNRVPTFAEAAEKVLAIHAATWKDKRAARHWQQSLRDYAGPINRKKVDLVTSADVLKVLTPLWNEKRATAQRLRQRIGLIMKWAIAEGLRFDNPAGEAIGQALPRGGQRVVHHKALPHSEVAAAIKTIRATNAARSSILALEFLVLTAARSTEVRGARWDEIDQHAGVWTISGDRMKSGQEHRVPLSTGAFLVLEQVMEISGGSGLVFPSPRKGKMISERTLGLLLTAHGVDCTPHGMRSSFRDWSSETGVSSEAAEAALAHTVRNRVEAAYRRSDLLNARVQLMQEWSDYLGYQGLLDFLEMRMPESIGRRRVPEAMPSKEHSVADDAEPMGIPSREDMRVRQGHSALGG